MSAAVTPEIFISYARRDEPRAKRVADALMAQGYGVWRDDELPAHRTYSEVIEERLQAAGAVVVIWSAEAAKSQWVRAEADLARGKGTLVQISVDGTVPPMPFNQIQCADLQGWDGDVAAPGWRKVEGSVTALIGAGGGPDPEIAAPNTRRSPKLSVCVLPFTNMSGDAEQEYFSDGISEDITTDLSKVSALSVVSRHTAFTLKGSTIDVQAVARQLNVSHVLEGSVRKAGNRVRISAQLTDGGSGNHAWAERYDRDLTDIFEIQDEISKAIVAALKVRLLPEEKKAIEERGTNDPEAYDLYLMAREYWVSGNDGDPRRDDIILRLCQRAVEIDPRYARAWALMALAQSTLKFRNQEIEEDGMAAAEQALLQDPELAEPHCVKAAYLARQGRHDEAISEIEIAVRQAPESWEVNKEAGLIMYDQGRLGEAASFFGKAATVMETDYRCAGLLTSCLKAIGQQGEARRAAQLTLERAERALAFDRSNGAALGFGAGALAYLGDGERAADWIRRALLIDPGNRIMRYNLACSFASELNDPDAALELLDTWFPTATAAELRHVAADPDFVLVREHPTYKRMFAAAKKRTGATSIESRD